MKKRFLLILPLLILWSCVGQLDDPISDPFPDPGSDPGTESGDSGATTEEGGGFYRRVLALEFTGTWCQWCPQMADALEGAMAQRPGRLVDISVYCMQYSEFQDLKAPESEGIMNLFNKAMEFPLLVLDWDDDTSTTRKESSVMVKYVDKASASPCPCGIMLSSRTDGESLSVSVSIKAAESGAYSVFAAIVEDDILVTQQGAGANYPCRSVLRGYLDGDYLKGRPASLKAEEEYTADYSVAMPAHPSKCRIVAYVTRGGKVVNATTAPLNAKTDYLYEKVDHQ